jgi:hypothetical protein
MIDGVDALDKEIRQPEADVEQTGIAATEKASEQTGADTSAFHVQSYEERAEYPTHETDPQCTNKPREWDKSMRPNGIRA